MKRKPDVEKLEIPIQYYRFGQKRVRPMVRWAASMGQFGVLDLDNLAVSAYLQGVWDGVQIAEKNLIQPKSATQHVVNEGKQ